MSKPVMSESSGREAALLTRRTLLAGAGAAAMTGVTGAGSASAAEGTPKRGGELRVAILGGSESDMLDPHAMATQPDTGRALALYESLIDVDHQVRPYNVMAESVESNKDATEWTVRLKPGLEFHDGRKVTSRDVAASFARIANPKKPLNGALLLQRFDIANMKALDDRTVRLPMTKPYSTFVESMASCLFFAVLPEDFDPAKPIGSGPYKVESFTPGQESVFTRFDGYREGGMPYIDKLTIIDSFATPTAAFNALQGGQVDAYVYAPPSLVRQASQNKNLKAVVAGPGQWIAYNMRVDKPPFDNPDVRQAMRLVIDREQIAKIALSGYAVVASDVFSPSDPSFDKSLKRARDVEQAKALLKRSGHENLTVELTTANVASGVLATSQIIARQAAEAGITVNVREVTPDVYYGQDYENYTFGPDYWSTSSYFAQVSQSMMKGAFFNGSHWDDPEYTKLYDTAMAEVDAQKRGEIARVMQKIDFERGGVLIPTFNRNIDLVTSRLQGLEPSSTGYGFGNWNWRGVWLD